MSFTREDESRTVRFNVRPAPAGARPGEYTIAASATLGDRVYVRGFQTIEYPHIRRQHIYAEADATLKIIDVKIASDLTVGYIMGVGDEVPPAIEQLGAKLEMISPDDLAWGNLSRFDVIVTGVRAYERRADLRANNSRLLDYVRDGGTLIVQYNKFEFNEAQYGPYPAKVTSERVTDERAGVTRRQSDRPAVRRRRTRSAETRGRAGCRSAASTSSPQTTRATASTSRSATRSRTTPARRPARWCHG